MEQTSMNVIIVEKYGYPEVLKLAQAPIPKPGAGELLIKVMSSGLNFADTMVRKNQYITTAVYTG